MKPRRRSTAGISLLLFLLFFVRAHAGEITLRDNGQYGGVFCPWEEAHLSCPEGKVLSHVSGNYGRLGQYACNPHSVALDDDDKCVTVEATSRVLAERCPIGSTSCTFPADKWPDFFPPKDELCNKTRSEMDLYLDILFACAPPGSSTIPPSTTQSTRVKEEEKDDHKPLPPTQDPSPLVECPVEVVDVLVFPRTVGGKKASVACPSGSQGRASLSCSVDGTWSKEINYGECTREMMRKNLGEMKIGVAMKKADIIVEYGRKMREEATTAERLFPGDTTVLLDAMKTVTEQRELLGEEMTEALRRDLMMSIEIAVRSESAWQFGGNDDDRRHMVMNVLNGVEKMMAATAWQKSKGQILRGFTIDTSVVGMETPFVHSSSSYTGRGFSGDWVQVPLALLPRNTPHAHFVFTASSVLGDFLAPKGTKDKIVSRIIGATVYKDRQALKVEAHSSMQREGKAVPKVRLFLHHNLTGEETRPRCVWLDTRERHWGEWREDGCSLVHHNASSSTCDCDHLTHFAILMDVSGKKLDALHEELLSWATTIGCGVSVVCLLASFAAFSLFSRNGGDRVFIHKNLCLTLAAAEGLFLLAISRTESLMGCRLVAACLLFLFLSSLLWMLAEGVQLYLMLVEVFSGDSRRMHFFLACYGLPLVVVLVSLVADQTAFGTPAHCWLTPHTWVFVASFVVPAGVIMAMNWGFLFLALCVVWRHRSRGYMPCRHDNGGRKTKTCVKGAVALAFLLGLSWSLGFLYMESDSSPIVAYVFTLVNSLQGLFIFLFHVILCPKMRSDAAAWMSRRGLHCGDSPRSSGASSSRTGKGFSPTGDCTLFMEGGETSDSSLLGPRALYGHPSYMHNHALLHDYGPGTYDYATISYADMVSVGGARTSSLYSARLPPPHLQPHVGYAPPPYLRQLYGGMGGVSTGLYGVSPDYTSRRRPPPECLPPSPPSSHPPSAPRPGRPPSSKISDDSAYSDASNASVLASEVTSSGATVLRIDFRREEGVVEGEEL